MSQPACALTINWQSKRSRFWRSSTKKYAGNDRHARRAHFLSRGAFHFAIPSLQRRRGTSPKVITRVNGGRDKVPRSQALGPAAANFRSACLGRKAPRTAQQNSFDYKRLKQS